MRISVPIIPPLAPRRPLRATCFMHSAPMVIYSVSKLPPAKALAQEPSLIAHARLYIRDLDMWCYDIGNK